MVSLIHLYVQQNLPKVLNLFFRDYGYAASTKRNYFPH